MKKNLPTTLLWCPKCDCFTVGDAKVKCQMCGKNKPCRKIK